jgi:hypothetical protein
LTEQNEARNATAIEDGPRFFPVSAAHRTPERNPTPGSLSTAKLVPFFAASDTGGPLDRSCDVARGRFLSGLSK